MTVKTKPITVQNLISFLKFNVKVNAIDPKAEVFMLCDEEGNSASLVNKDCIEYNPDENKLFFRPIYEEQEY